MISLVTGGTGTIGSALVRSLLRKGETVRIFSRDESGQHEMQQQLTAEGFDLAHTRFLIGDIRDRDRVDRALDGVDTVYHAAAMKHVSACEYNPFEAVQTNIMGVENLIAGAVRRGVSKVVNMSSDKAVDPANLMGMTKAVAERLLIQANTHGKASRFVSVRFGNVLGSRGSVWPLWDSQARKKGMITVTDPGMTRFVMTLPQAVDLCLDAARLGLGGEVFVRRMPVMILQDLAMIFVGWFSKVHNIDPGSIEVKVVGAAPGETPSEDLCTAEEYPRARTKGGMIAVVPNSLFRSIDFKAYDKWPEFGESRNSNTAIAMNRAELRGFLVEAGLIR